MNKIMTNESVDYTSLDMCMLTYAKIDINWEKNNL